MEETRSLRVIEFLPDYVGDGEGGYTSLKLAESSESSEEKREAAVEFEWKRYRFTVSSLEIGSREASCSHLPG